MRLKVMSTYSESWINENNYRKASKFLGWTSWKSHFNAALTGMLDKRHLPTPFHSEGGKTTSSKQARSFNVRKEINYSEQFIADITPY